MKSEKIRDVFLEILNEVGQPIDVKVHGWSMIPALREGDRLVLAFTRDVRVGDIIIFKREGNLIAHRLMRSFKNEHLTKGDSLWYFDPLVKKDDVLGKVTGIKRADRTIDLQSGRWIALNYLISLYSYLVGVLTPRLSSIKRKVISIVG